MVIHIPHCNWVPEVWHQIAGVFFLDVPDIPWPSLVRMHREDVGRFLMSRFRRALFSQRLSYVQWCQDSSFSISYVFSRQTNTEFITGRHHNPSPYYTADTDYDVNTQINLGWGLVRILTFHYDVRRQRVSTDQTNIKKYTILSQLTTPFMPTASKTSFSYTK